MRSSFDARFMLFTEEFKLLIGVGSVMTTVVLVAACAGATITPVTAIADADARARTVRAEMRAFIYSPYRGTASEVDLARDHPDAAAVEEVCTICPNMGNIYLLCNENLTLVTLRKSGLRSALARTSQLGAGKGVPDHEPVDESYPASDEEGHPEGNPSADLVLQNPDY